MAVRLGLRMIDGVSRIWAELIPRVRARGLWRFRHLHPPHCADAGAGAAPGGGGRFRGVRNGSTRRRVAVAQGQAQGGRAAGRRACRASAPPPPLPELSASEEVVADYRTTRLSLKGHPMSFLRPVFACEGVRRCVELQGMADATPLSVAGVVLVRQRPGNGRVCFITVEDETDVANLVVVMDVFEAHRAIIMSSAPAGGAWTHPKVARGRDAPLRAPVGGSLRRARSIVRPGERGRLRALPRPRGSRRDQRSDRQRGRQAAVARPRAAQGAGRAHDHADRSQASPTWLRLTSEAPPRRPNHQPGLPLTGLRRPPAPWRPHTPRPPPSIPVRRPGAYRRPRRETCRARWPSRRRA